MKKIIFILLLPFVLLFAYGFNKEDIRAFKQSEILHIQTAYLHADPIGGFADGKYELKEYVISQEDRYIYKLKMLFIFKKKRYLYYKQEVTLPFLYDGKRLWIKYKGSIYKYKVPKNALVRYKKQDKEFIQRVQRPLQIKIENLVLKVNF